MIKDIFVPMLGSASDDAALSSAIDLAAVHGAQISALITVEIPLPFFSEVGFVAGEVNAKTYNMARESAEALAEKTRQRLADAGLSPDVRIIDTSAASRGKIIAEQARYSDLTIMGGRDSAATTTVATVTFESLLMQSGRPVIVVPVGVPLIAKPKRVVMAWQPSREATRAVHDAMPLLGPGTQLDLLIIEPEKMEQQEGERPGSRIAEKLTRSGLPVRIVAQPKDGRSEGENLLHYMDQTDADLLVMGGYGHSRMRELILGGTTRTVLDGLTRPVFFEH